MSYELMLTAMALTLVIATAVGSKFAKVGFPLPSGSRIGCVDGLRGYLAISVMFHHCIIWLSFQNGQPWVEPTSNLYNQLGKSAVALFFMTTGLVFYSKINNGIFGNNWFAIYNSRFFRIIPMLLLSTLLCATIVAFENGVTPNRYFPIEIVSWLAGKQIPLMNVKGSSLVNAGVLWSISWEWLFYFLLLPLFATLRQVLKYKSSWYFLALLLAVSLLGRFTGYNLFKFSPLFIIGMFAGEAVNMPNARVKLARSSVSYLVIMAIILEVTAFHDPYGLIQMCLLGFVFISIACGNGIFGILSSRGALVLGEISFSIYVLHGIALYVIFHLIGINWSPIIFMPVIAFFVLIASTCTFFIVERPGMALGRWFYSKFQAQVSWARKK